MDMSKQTWGHGDSKRFSDLPKVIRLVNGRAGVWTQAFSLQTVLDSQQRLTASLFIARPWSMVSASWPLCAWKDSAPWSCPEGNRTADPSHLRRRSAVFSWTAEGTRDKARAKLWPRWPRYPWPPRKLGTLMGFSLLLYPMTRSCPKSLAFPPSGPGVQVVIWAGYGGERRQTGESEWSITFILGDSFTKPQSFCPHVSPSSSTPGLLL